MTRESSRLFVSTSWLLRTRKRQTIQSGLGWVYKECWWPTVTGTSASSRTVTPITSRRRSPSTEGGLVLPRCRRLARWRWLNSTITPTATKSEFLLLSTPFKGTGFNGFCTKNNNFEKIAISVWGLFTFRNDSSSFKFYSLELFDFTKALTQLIPLSGGNT